MSNGARSILRYGQYAMWSIGVSLCAYWSFIALSSQLFQHRETIKFARTVRTAAPDPLRPQPEGSTIARLEIPRLGLSTMVVEGDNGNDLKHAAGHIPGTSLPGERGNSGIAGHRDTFFRPLRGVRIDDTITVTTLRGTFTYRVVSTQVARPNEIQVLYPTRTESLTLVTCYPFQFVGPAPRRFIVHAERIS